MEESEVVVTLSLGSNLVNKDENLKNALNLIVKHVGRLLCLSDFYHSKPWGFSSQNDFVNCCCLVSTKHSINDLIATTQAIEREMGRKEKDKKEYSDRIIDIDVIFYGERIIKSDEITVPHRNFKKRDFVLTPLLQLTNCIDPETFITIKQFTE